MHKHTPNSKTLKLVFADAPRFLRKTSPKVSNHGAIGTTLTTFNKATNGYPVPFPSAVWNTNRPAVQFYWHAPATNKVYCLATARGYTIRSEAVYTVISPDFTLTNTVGATVTIDSTNYYQPGLYVHFGTGDPYTAGINFTVVTNSTVETNFEYQFVQTLTNVYFKVDYIDGTLQEMLFSCFSLNVLDLRYPTGFDVPAKNRTSDSPGTDITPYEVGGTTYYPTNVVSGFTANTYLFYKSTEPSTDAIWVPLVVTPWSLSYDVTKTNGINGNWVVKSISVPPLHPLAFKTNSYPRWTNNSKDLPVIVYSPN